MDIRMKAALGEYGRTIKARGWEAGEPIIVRGEKEFPSFRRWAYAVGIMLRAKEILEDRGEGPKPGLNSGPR